MSIYEGSMCLSAREESILVCKLHEKYPFTTLIIELKYIIKIFITIKIMQIILLTVMHFFVR